MMYFLILFAMILFSNCEIERNGKMPVAKIEQDSLRMDNDTSIYTVIEKMPILLECENKENAANCSSQKLLQYLYTHISYNPISKENGIDSKIVATFVIEKDGSVSNIEILKGKGISNVIEVIQKMPKWKPGSQNGLIKRVKYHLPIRVCYR